MAQRYSPYLKNYHQRKMSRGAGKGVVALSRKFPEIICWTHKHNQVFEDSPNFVLATDAAADANAAHASVLACPAK